MLEKKVSFFTVNKILLVLAYKSFAAGRVFVWSYFEKAFGAGMNGPSYLSCRFGLRNQASWVESNGIGLMNEAF